MCKNPDVNPLLWGKKCFSMLVYHRLHDYNRLCTREATLIPKEQINQTSVGKFRIEPVLRMMEQPHMGAVHQQL